jgi:hypothetical protein
LNIALDKYEKIYQKMSEIKNYIPRVAIFGKTGVGKSSLCNALFGSEISEVSDVEACTREPQEFMLNIVKSSGKGLILIDCPGLGETPERDIEYKTLYKKLIPELDIILWVLDSSERAYGADISAYKELFNKEEYSEKLIFVLNKVEEFKPKTDWNKNKNVPGEKQSQLILRKEADVGKAFSVSEDKICSISVEKKYSLNLLLEIIISLVPNEKKYSFIREAIPEHVTDKAKTEAKKGFMERIWEEIKSAAQLVKETGEKVGDFYERNKKEINYGLATIAAIFAKWQEKNLNIV